MNKTAIICSGGDGSGINSVIDVISKNANIDLYGFDNSFDGIIHSKPIQLTRDHCSHHSLDGKQLILTSRSKAPYTKEGRQLIQKKLQENNFEYLIVCGGNGSKKAATLLEEDGVKTIFIPMTVDNDVGGSEYSIGFDTALNRVTSIVHDLHDTAHNMPGRIFMVEVLGGNCGNLALHSAIATASDMSLIPEFPVNHEKISEKIKEKLKFQDAIIIICSEAAYENENYKTGEQGVSFEIADEIEKNTNIRVRKSIVGFSMRSGNPTFKDAMVATRMGMAAVEHIEDDNTGFMIGIVDDAVHSISLKNDEDFNNNLNKKILELAIKKDLIIEGEKKYD
ncbi:6-phosphofructokinase [Salinicoccus hispanicus]|uniref:6-phosphofructokinase n=1 Tax=Salinicoccus hispanicus TaxID=157225 RepID=A0A6N8U7K4_9STAP|nr:6-phosphofructokinase [Salinicoccus hispanicus]MXQ51629.1 hypothetical protein [Salinicoccus hispanicus]